MPLAREVAAIAVRRLRMSLGMHVDLTGEGTGSSIDLDDVAECKSQILRQVRRFEDLFQRSPTHVDAHHDIHAWITSRPCSPRSPTHSVSAP